MPSRVPRKTCSLPSVISDGDDRITLVDAHRDDAAGARIAERGQVGLLDRALARAHDDELLFLAARPLLDGKERGDLLAFLHRHQVGDALPLPPGPTSGIS